MQIPWRKQETSNLGRFPSGLITTGSTISKIRCSWTRCDYSGLIYNVIGNIYGWGVFDFYWFSNIALISYFPPYEPHHRLHFLHNYRVLDSLATQAKPSALSQRVPSRGERLVGQDPDQFSEIAEHIVGRALHRQYSKHWDAKSRYRYRASRWQVRQRSRPREK